MYTLTRNNLELLSRKFYRVQSDYERARSRGDIERVKQFRIQLDAIIAERNRLARRSPSDALANTPTSGS